MRPTWYLLRKSTVSRYAQLLGSIVQDGVRDGEHIHTWMTGRFRQKA
jgi:hypothetical protein